jgi:hypothetical protein
MAQTAPAPRHAARGRHAGAAAVERQSAPRRAAAAKKATEPSPLPPAPPKKGLKTLKAPKAGKTFHSSNPRRLVMVEFVICFMILGFGTVVPRRGGEKQGTVGHIVVKGSALALLFVVLSLIASGGDKSAKAAGALGALVTLGYVMTSEDASRVLGWVSDFYSRSPSAAAAPSAAATAAGPPLAPTETVMA